MIYDFVIASIGGAIGTALMTGMMLIGKQMGIPAVDAHGILGYMLNSEKASPVGYIMHWILGVVFAIGYAIVFQYVPRNVIFLGTMLGIIHWIIVGWLFAFAPIAHAGMQAGTVPEPGAYMMKSLGFPGFIAGMVGHIVFGLTVTLVYVWAGGSLAVA